MSEWKTRRLTNEVGYGYIVVREDGYIVVRDDGRVMATCKYRETCEQITREHNSHAALLDIAKGSLELVPPLSRDAFQLRDYITAAIELAEPTP